MKDKAFYRALPYTRRVDLVQEDGHEYFVASIVELPGVRADGQDHVEALYRLDQAFDEYLDAMLDWGEVIPEPELWQGEIGPEEEPAEPAVRVEGVANASQGMPESFPWKDAAPRWRSNLGAKTGLV